MAVKANSTIAIFISCYCSPLSLLQLSLMLP